MKRTTSGGRVGHRTLSIRGVRQASRSNGRRVLFRRGRRFYHGDPHPVHTVASPRSHALAVGSEARYRPGMLRSNPTAQRRLGLFVGDECPLCHQDIQPSEPRLISFEELAARSAQSTEMRRDEIVGLLTAAVSILHHSKSEWERACWRVADALLLLGEKFPNAHGIAERTGRGAKLSRPARSPRR